MMEENQGASRILSISFWVLFVTAILLPIFFIPCGVLSLSFSKSLLVYSGVSLAEIFLLFYVFKAGKFALPNKVVLWGAFLVILSFFLSTILGENFLRSEIGYGFEIGTFSFIFLFFTLLFSSVVLFQNGERINKAPLILIIPFIILAVYHLIKLFFGWDLISFGSIFAGKITTPLGGWNELGIIAGASVLLSLIGLDILRSEGTSRLLYKISIILGLLLLVVVNFSLAWIILLSTCVLFFILRVRNRRINSVTSETSQNIPQPTQNKNVSQVGQDIVFQNKIPQIILRRDETENSFWNKHLYTIIVAAISLIFILPSGSFITQKIYKFFDINYTEVRLSFRGTGEILSNTLKQDKTQFFLGSGPNNFLPEWRAGKPESVNLTNFWNSEFHYAIGLIPTFFVTTGFLGILSWLIFLISFCVLGLRQVYSNPTNLSIVTSFFVSLYLWLMTIFYLPSHSLFLFTALFSGIFLASYLYNRDSKSVKSTVVLSQSRLSKILLIVIFTVFVVVNIINTFHVYKKSVGAANFEKGLTSFSSGNLKETESYFKAAVEVSESDIYRRYLSEFYLLKLRQFVQDVKEPNDEQVKTFEELFQNALQNIKIALDLNPDNLENRIQFGKLYQFLAEMKTEGAYGTAKDIYLEAQTLDPNNPLLSFLLANLEVTSGTLDEALKFVTDAISKKPNFGDAMLLHSRIKFSQGDIAGAIVSGIEAIKIFPQEPYLYFHLGLLYYQKGEFENAILALNEALILLPDFANARYFGGLSLAKVGKTAEAIAQFEKIQETNQDNAEVKLILENLRAGRDPFFEAKPPADVDPAKRSELPLEEKEE